MAFEVFSKKSASRSKTPTITVQKKGIISLSPSAVDLLAGGEEKEQHQIELLFDPERKIVGLRLSGEDNPNPHLLRRQGKSGVYLVSGKLFTAHYGIDTTKARRYRAKDYGEGIVGICLTDDFAEVGRKVRRGDRQSEGTNRETVSKAIAEGRL